MPKRGTAHARWLLCWAASIAECISNGLHLFAKQGRTCQHHAHGDGLWHSSSSSAAAAAHSISAAPCVQYGMCCAVLTMLADPHGAARTQAEVGEVPFDQQHLEVMAMAHVHALQE
jgi:hypothetical protein